MSSKVERDDEQQSFIIVSNYAFTTLKKKKQ